MLETLLKHLKEQKDLGLTNDILMETFKSAIKPLKYSDKEVYDEVVDKLYKECYGEHFSDWLAEKAVENFKNVDGTEGAHWSVEQIDDVIRQYGIKCIGFNRWDYKKQYILFADTGIETGCQTAGGRYIYQFPVSLCRKVHLTMRCQQLQRRDTDNGRIGKQPPGQGSYTQTGTLIHGKFPDNGIHISAVVHHRINAQANVAKSNVRGVEAYRTPRATGIIIDRSSSQQEFSPAIELVFQVGSSVRNLSISYMGFQPHGVQWHL